MTSTFLRGAERRIEWWTLGLGGGAAALAAAGGAWRTAMGIAAGTFLAWIHYRWLRGNVALLETLSIQQAGEEKPRVPRRVSARFKAGYALLIGVLCASFFFSAIPALAVGAGLLSLVAAVMAEGVYQLARGWREGAG
jgi:hypothetical protein